MHLSNFIVVPGIPEDFSLSLKSSSLRLRFEHSGTVFKVYVLGDNSRVTHISVYIANIYRIRIQYIHIYILVYAVYRIYTHCLVPDYIFKGAYIANSLRR